MLTKFSVKKPYSVVVAVAIIVIFGIVSLMGLRWDLLPDVDYPYAVIVTEYNDASPSEIEEIITTPVEKAAAGVSKVKNINSVSTEGKSIVTVEFNQSAEMDSVVAELREALEPLENEWSSGVSTPVISKINPNAMPVMVASVSIDGENGVSLSNFVNETLRTYFDGIDGVADADVRGIVEEEIQVTINSTKIDAINNNIFTAIGGDYAKARAALNATDTGLNTVTSGLLSQTNTIDAQLRTLNSQLVKAESEETQRTANITTYQAQVNQYQTEIAELDNNIAQTQQNIDSLNARLINTVDPTERANLQTQIATETDNKTKYENARSVAQQNMTTAQTNLTSAQNINNADTISHLKQQIADLTTQRAAITSQMSNAEATVADSKAGITKRLSELDEEEQTAKNEADLRNLITTDMVSSMLESQNFSSTAGSLDLGNKSYDVTVGDKINSVTELQNLILFHFDLDKVGDVMLSQVADIAVVNNGGEVYSKINGNDAVLVSFYKQSDYSVAETADAIHDTIREIKAAYPSARIDILSDQSVYVDRVGNAVGENLLIGAVLAVLILFLFLRDIRPTLVVAASIPASILFALALMYFTGVTLNVFSMSGLALGVGMLVDNSIVVMENIYRCRSIGLSRTNAATEGAKQVTAAIITSTLTTMCVFFPVLFMDGLSKQLFMDIGLTIAYSLLASLLVALTLVPSLSSGVLRKMKPGKKDLIQPLLGPYKSILCWVLGHRVFVGVFALLLMVFTGIFAVSAGTSFLPRSDSLEMTINVTLKGDGTTRLLWDTTNEISDRLMAMDDVKSVGAVDDNGGNITLGGVSEGNSTMLYVTLKEDKSKSCAKIAEEIQDQGDELGCNLDITVGSYDFSSLFKEGISITVKGNDINELAKITEDMGDLLLSVEGTERVKSSMDMATPTLKITVDKAAAMEYGLTVSQVYEFISESISNSANATTLAESNGTRNVIVVDGTVTELTPADIQNLKMTVKDDSGNTSQVVIGTIASITEEEGAPIIYHDGQIRYMTASADITDGYNVGLVSNEIQELVDGYALPEGYTVTITGERLVITDTVRDILITLALAFVLMYLIMVAQFQSLLMPLVIMLTVPMAFTGGFLALLIARMDMSIVALVGFLLLSGIVVNNGIVLVDYINRLRRDGRSMTVAILEGGCTRMRPILMTASTTILALLTLAFGLGLGAKVVQPMAVVVLGGMIWATLATLFVLPALYDLLLRRKRDRMAEAAAGSVIDEHQQEKEDKEKKKEGFFKSLMLRIKEEDDAYGSSDDNDDLKNTGIPAASNYFVSVMNDDEEDEEEEAEAGEDGESGKIASVPHKKLSFAQLFKKKTKEIITELKDEDEGDGDEEGGDGTPEDEDYYGLKERKKQDDEDPGND